MAMMTQAPGVPAEIPFVNELGLQLVASGEGRAELRLAVTSRHLNSWGVAHGGVLMTLLDVAMAQAARTRAVEGGAPSADSPPGVATVEMKTMFLRAAQGQLKAVGTVLSRTPTMVFCEASIFDADQDLCAHATGTFKILRALPVKQAS